MSRMVRENEASGLRERVFLARELMRELDAGRGGDGYARRLALRGGVIFHLYSALLGVLRQAARSYRVTGFESALSLVALEKVFADAAVESAELNLIKRARSTPGDPVAWLEVQMQTACGAAGLARRPAPPQEEAGLAMRADDPDVVLGEADLLRLNEAIERVSGLLDEVSRYAEEW